MSERDEARRQEAPTSGGDAGGAAEPATGETRRTEIAAPRIVVRPAARSGDTHAQSVADTAVLEQSSLGAAATEVLSAGAPHGTPGLLINAATLPPAGPDDEASEDPLVGKILLDRYRITGQIGKGGMGAVYEAQHTLIGKRVAIKVLLDQYARKTGVVARLEQEARLASSIGHEHIVDITDFGETPDGRTFVVMEYLEGESLGHCLRREDKLDEQRAIRIAHQAASALSAAHAKGILHRDIKPENIFLLVRKGTDFVKVVDFGISKSLHTGEGEGSTPRLTQTGMVLGTPLYMSPEQARGEEDLDQRIDVYGLGVILYEMVTGMVPFQGSNSLNIIARVINEQPKPPRDLRPDISPELEAVILHAMAKNRDERYASCDALAADLAALLEEASSTGSNRVRVSAPLPMRRRTKEGPPALVKLAGSVVTVGAVLMVAWLIWGNRPAKETVTPAPPAVPAVVAEPAPVAAPAVEPEAPEATLEKATIRITSEPAGATIYEGGRVRGTTPFDLQPLKKDDDIELVAKLDGYEDTPFRINAAEDDQRQVSVKLEKLASSPRPGNRPRPAPTTTTKPSEQRTSPSSTGTAAGELSGNPYRRTDQ
jgi:predicted Ser/Thr protein kinase